MHAKKHTRRRCNNNSKGKRHTFSITKAKNEIPPESKRLGLLASEK